MLAPIPLSTEMKLCALGWHKPRQTILESIMWDDLENKTVPVKIHILWCGCGKVIDIEGIQEEE